MAYTRASTDNPLGFRPWQSRLGAYTRASFCVPTSGLGCNGCKKRGMSGCGLSGPGFPNFAAAGESRGRAFPRFIPRGAPYPNVYRAPELVISRGMSGLGQTSTSASTTIQLPSGQTISISTQPTGGLPSSITTWLDAQYISGVPNKYLVLGGLLFMFLRK